MTIATRRLSSFGAFLILLVVSSGIFSSSASAQATVPATPFELFMAHFSLGISAGGQFTSTSQGTNYLKQSVYLEPSNALGVLAEIRYTKSPRIGAQFNYGFARYTNNYNITNTSASTAGTQPLVLGVQAQAAEFTLGYVGHFGQFFGVHPFVGAGGGVLAFRPTPGGGEGLVGESRGVVYYAVGAEAPLLGGGEDSAGELGVRVQFRQLFFGAPDFNTNYLANGQRSSTAQPTFGFYLKF